MGMGNHLLVNDQVYDKFVDKLGNGLRESQVYTNWIPAAWKVIKKREKEMSLDKAYDIMCDYYDDFASNVENEEFSQLYIKAMEYIIYVSLDNATP